MGTRRLVLLDFDGTLTTSDTFLHFIKFYHGWFKFTWGFILLSPWLIAMKLKLLANDRVKQIVLRFFFGNVATDVFNRHGADFARTIIPKLLRRTVLPLLTNERALNSRIIVISASPENWVKPWCDSQGIECLATRLEIEGQKITGNITGKNCFGAEKVSRLREIVSLSDFHPVIAYGDSNGDHEMLALADEKFFRKL